MNIEDVFASRLRVKILSLLLDLGQLNASELATRMRINYQTTRTHLKILEDEGLVVHRLFGRSRLFRINEQSQKAKAFHELVQTWWAAEPL